MCVLHSSKTTSPSGQTVFFSGSVGVAIIHPLWILTNEDTGTSKSLQTCFSVAHVVCNDLVTLSKHHCYHCLTSEGLSHHSVVGENPSHPQTEGVSPRQTEEHGCSTHPVIFFVSLCLLSETKSLLLIGTCLIFHVCLYHPKKEAGCVHSKIFNLVPCC